MKTWPALWMHELRNARSSLTAAAALTVLLLVILHTFGCTPIETATGLPFLWCLCALQFAADSFATDLASGKLAARAALPVSARELWGAKLFSFVASIALLSGIGIALECVWQAIFGAEQSCWFFLLALPSMENALTVLALIGSAGMLCSLLVESALAAMLLTGLVLGALWGLSLAVAKTVKLTGPNALSENPSLAAIVIAAVLLLISYFAFARSQRKLGNSAIRVSAVLIGALALTLGLGGTVMATRIHWSTYGLEDARMDIYPPISSPDGRFIAFEAHPSGGANDGSMYSVWVLDLETKEKRLLAGPGMLVRNSYNGGYQAWTEENGLCVLAPDSWFLGRKPESLRIREINGELHKETIAVVSLVAAPKLPDWALVKETHLKKREGRAVYVQWKEKNFEHTFEGRLGHDVFISPTPGRVIARRDNKLVLVDLESGAERTLTETGLFYLSLSPDSLALIVHVRHKNDVMAHLLSTVDGSELHSPWTKDDNYSPRWIEGDSRSHVMHLSATQRGFLPRILDLDLGREVEIADIQNELFARVADRGYVMLDERHDLVWIDREGKLVRTLIERRRS